MDVMVMVMVMVMVDVIWISGSFINIHDDDLTPGLECDEKFYSIEEGKCIDVTVPGAIPNWLGAPAVK